MRMWFETLGGNLVLVWDSPSTHYLGSNVSFWSSRSPHVVKAIKGEAQPHLDAMRKIRKELQDSVDHAKVQGAICGLMKVWNMSWST